MAAAAQLRSLKEEATCSICLDYFTDPVSIECGHNFCRSCITQSWEGRDGNFPCPECREISSVKKLRPNRQLGNMVEITKQLHLPPVRPPEENLCKKHGEKPRTTEGVPGRTHQVIQPVQRSCQVLDSMPGSLVLDSMPGSLDGRSTLERFHHVKIQSPEMVVKSYKVMVTLDPDTAHPLLLLSEGGRRVKGTNTVQPLPDTPKRFTSYRWVLGREEETRKRFTHYYHCVLGSEGFTSGRHYWEVQLLHDGGVWRVGVAAESVNRKGYLTWSPEGGLWTMGGWDGQYWALTSPETLLHPREKPLKLGVYLDYEGGHLSLYNADSMELLYTFPQAPFTERLFPIFNPWGGAELRLV